MRRFTILTTLALVLACVAPLAAQDRQERDRGGLGGVLDTLGSVLGGGTQTLRGTVVVTEGSTFVLRTDDGRTVRVDAASLDPRKSATLAPGRTVSVTARGGGQAGVLTASEITPDAQGEGKTFQTVTGTVQEAGRERVLFKTRDGLVLPVDVGRIQGLPYLAANQPATLYYEQGPRQEVVGVWIQPGGAQPAASAAAPGAPSASVPSAQTVEGLVQSVGIGTLTLQTGTGQTVTVDTSRVDREALRAIAPGDVVAVRGTGGGTSDRFVAESVQARR
jgi:hypothetical protein